MTWLVWRQYRAQAAIAAVLLAAFAAVLLVTGLQMASQWHTIMAQCTASGTCANVNGQGQLSLGSALGSDLVILSAAVPAVLGIFWGAPLVAHEIESGTGNFTWTQGVTRMRWLAVKAAWMLLAAAIWGGLVSAIVTWWSGPRNAAFQQAFQSNYFDRQGLVPIGYAVFATALGIAAGTLLRRTLPAIALVIGGFIGVRLFISQYVRQHFMTAVTTYYNPLANYSPPGSAWVLAQGVVDKNGQVYSGGNAPQVNGVPVTALPASCRSLLFRDPTTLVKAQVHQAAACARASGYRGFTTYQPASRFWAFQGIETGIFLALAALLVAVTFVVVSRRDA
jgi:ABC-type transport system involved in multi-copper enzyme maturation permease subunit